MIDVVVSVYRKLAAEIRAVLTRYPRVKRSCNCSKHPESGVDVLKRVVKRGA
jgi:hypothetical protein